MFEHWSKTQKYIGQILFWIGYYILFSVIWVREGDYIASFYLEFIYMPIRLLVTYAVILYLIPEFLTKKKLKEFLVFYACILIVGSVLQNVFFYFFYEGNTKVIVQKIFEVNAIIRAGVLLNTTVMVVSSIKILDLFFIEKSKNEIAENIFLELKSNRRTHRISPDEIKYIEGMGNYVTYHLEKGKKIVVYQSLKDSIAVLSEDFVRVQKSFIVNKKKVASYDSDSIELDSGELIPVGKSANVDDVF
ncbi:MAG: LytTR family DNA-binding domain-containing protein [Balneola sp.]